MCKLPLLIQDLNRQELDVPLIEPPKQLEEDESDEESADEEGLAMAKVFDEFVDSEDDAEYVEKLQGASEDEDEDDDGKSEAEKLAERKAKVDQYILKIGEQSHCGICGAMTRGRISFFSNYSSSPISLQGTHALTLLRIPRFITSGSTSSYN